MNSIIPLDQINIGEYHLIEKISGSSLSLRLQELGFTQGERVKILKKSPFGDPILVKIMNYEISLRKKDAAEILVKSKIL